MRIDSRSSRLATLALTSCTGERGPLPPGPALGGYANAGKAESYTGVTLYGYMDGGADTFLEYGFSSLAVRRYTRGSTQVVVELYTMRDAPPRRPSTARCGAPAARLRSPPVAAPASETPRSGSHVGAAISSAATRIHWRRRMTRCATSARASSRDSRATAASGRALRDCRAEGRLAGSEVALAGPLGLNQRAWLAPLGREGFKRGVLATYAVPSGRAEVLLADYASAEAARAALEPLTKVPRPGTSGLTRGRRLVLVSSEGAAPETLAALASRLTADGR